jgi:hypothetical protein
MSHPVVKIEGCALSDNTYSDGDKVWVVANLVERARSLEPFDLPLAAIYSGSQVWQPVASAYDLAKQMRRVLDVDTAHPIILDQQGFIMDGWHRVTRALVDGKPTIKAVRFEKTPPPDYHKEKA